MNTKPRYTWVGWFFLSPLIAFNALVVLVPSLSNVYFSFTSWDGLGTPTWIGLDNYIRLVNDPNIHEAFLRNVIWTAVFLVVPMGLGIIGAYLLIRVRRGSAVFRLIFFTPYIVATVVSATIWGFIYSPKLGITAVLANLGFGDSKPINLLGTGETALFSVAFANIWQWWGFLLVVFFAAMKGVDNSLYEAAELDGASDFRKLISITLPVIRPTITFLVLMTIIWSFLIFDYVFIMTGGGPAGRTEVLGTLLYKSSFWSRESGYAAAIGVLMGAISLVVVTTYLQIRKRKQWDI